MKKMLALVLALCLGLAACGQQGSADSSATTPETTPHESGPRTITDVTGRDVEIPETVDRVVVLSAGECEIVYALGAGDLVVGRGEYCNYPAEAQDVTAVQSGAETNVEQIIALEPQVVIMSAMDQTEEQIAALETAGIAVILSTETNIDGVYASIRVIGEALNCQDAAEETVASMQATFDKLREDAALQSNTPSAYPTVYFEVSPLEYGLWTAGSNTFMDEIAQMLGLTNIFSDVDGWAQISEEQVIERNPDYIVTITMYFGEGETPEQEILNRTSWQEMTAIQNGAVYNANSDQISRPGPRLADAAQMLYDFVYGG